MALALVCGDSEWPGGGAGAGPRGPPSGAPGRPGGPAIMIGGVGLDSSSGPAGGPEDGGPGPQAQDSAVQVCTAVASKPTADSERPAAPQPVLANFSSENT